MLNGLIILCAYLIGSIPSGLWIGKIFYKTDIREHGSGNLGATNTFRILGKSGFSGDGDGCFKRNSSRVTSDATSIC